MIQAQHIKFHQDIVNVLMMVGVDINDAASYFVETFNQIKTLPGNLNHFGMKKDNVWVLREYYPNTPIMYKMTVVYQTAKEQADYYSMKYNSDMSESDYSPVYWVNIKLTKNKLHNHLVIHAEDAIKYAMAKAANILIGDNITPKPFISEKYLHQGRRMFPKGYKSAHSNNKRSTYLYNQRKQDTGDVSKSRRRKP